MADRGKVSSGVQELIGRLRDEGVQAGRQEADRIISGAQKRAAEIVAQAKSEAEEIRNKARADIEGERAASREAIQLAFRDAELKLRSEFRAVIAERVKRLVSMEMRDREFLRELILAIAGRAGRGMRKNQRVEVLLSDEFFATDGRSGGLTGKGRERARHLVLAITSKMLREGVALRPSGDREGGIRIRVVGEDLEIDLTDKAISDLLLKHLLPRYREIVLGVD
jgi:V/A-type H+-transporting ATPase subunit E